MSYPSSLDLAFGSEKATADSIGRLSFGKGSSTKIPTNEEELNEMIQEGLASPSLLNIDGDTVTLDLNDINPAVLESLPSNLAGIVCTDLESEDALIQLSYSVETDPELIITITTSPLPEGASKGVTLILKKAIVPLPDDSYVYDHFYGVPRDVEDGLVEEGDKYSWTFSSEDSYASRITPYTNVTPDVILGFVEAIGGSSDCYATRWIDYEYKNGKFYFAKSDIDSIGTGAEMFGLIFIESITVSPSLFG